MGLSEYQRKRRFDTTPEPEGKIAPGKSKKLAFVVQEHHASQLHYDFRLEIDGVLKSWAVPKGPSLNPHDHHLAIQTEDHPYEYRKFEGVIPKGNYGAGNVIIWDEGWYEARKGNPKDSQSTMRQELKKGHLTFMLHGQKLKGEFALIKMPHASEDNAWLLVKKGDEYASTTDVTLQDESVKSQRQVDDLGGRAPNLDDYPKRAKPWQVKPMLCTLVDNPFDGQDWLFEVKWDGYRAIGSLHGGEAELYSRNGIDFSQKYPAAFETLHSFKHDVIVDGEIVVVDQQGVSHFEWLQGYNEPDKPADQQAKLLYYLFDILWCDGRDVRGMPLKERKQLLKNIMPKSDVLRYSDDVETNGRQLFAEMKSRDLEGMVAKRANSPYREGERGQDWLKIKTHQRQEVVIGGYTEPRGGRKYLGSLLVGVYQKGQLVYVGHSGGGIPDEDRRKLRDRLAKIERRSSPFATEPKPNAPVHWVKPELVCEMSFTEWTSDGMMRHPEFKGLRPDKKPTEVHREKARPKIAVPSAIPERAFTRGEPTFEPMVSKDQLSGSAKGRSTLPENADGTGLHFEPTHLDKIFFPKHKYTKGDIFKYYKSVAEYILPYLKDRPCSLNRMPSGINGESFYQKNNEHLPDWVPHADIFSESNNANIRWMVGNNLETVLYMVQLGCVEINPWNSRVGRLDKPDWIVIDLDPDGNSFDKVVEVAQTVHDVCQDWGIQAYPKTSGKTGLHIYIPMKAKYSYEQGKNLAHLIALEVHKRQPKITSVERMPEKRKGKIYVDFLQNRQGQTLAAPYSLRPTPNATVSMPLHWGEVKPGLKPTDFTINNALKRIKRTGDLWRPVLDKSINLNTVLRRVDPVNY